MNRCSFNIYGVINNRLAVCEGIAKFVKLTLNKLGIECFICGGKCILENEKIEDHAWNVIKIEEDYYHIDVTWDIRRDDAQNKRIVPYDYFNLDDANISRDHFDFNMSFECTSMLYNYHAIMGRFISGKKQLIQLKKSKKKPYFNLLATCPHTTLFDKIDDLVGKNQISDSDGQEIKSKLMIGQSESVKIESYFYTLQTQIQPFLYRTKSREKPVNVRKNISNKELLVINIGNIANELYVNVLIEELKRAIAYGSSAAVVLDSISIVGNDKLKELIMGLSGQVRFTVIGDDVVALSGSDEQLFTTLVGRAKKIVVLSHNAGTSAVKWSQVFGEHDKQEQSYSVSKGGSYNSPIPFMASPNYNKQVNYNWKREYIVKPEKIMNLGYGEAFVYSGDINELAHVTFR